MSPSSASEFRCLELIQRSERSQHRRARPDSVSLDTGRHARRARRSDIADVASAQMTVPTTAMAPSSPFHRAMTEADRRRSMTPLLPVAEAQARLFAMAPRVAGGNVPLAQAAGRWTAEPVIARRSQPAADLSAMDGYAIRFADLPGPWRVVGESAAGRAFRGTDRRRRGGADLHRRGDAGGCRQRAGAGRGRARWRYAGARRRRTAAAAA